MLVSEVLMSNAIIRGPAPVLDPMAEMIIKIAPIAMNPKMIIKFVAKSVNAAKKDLVDEEPIPDLYAKDATNSL